MSSATSRPNQDNESGSSAEQQDALSSLITDACPDVPAITSDTANRIFDDAIRTVSASNDSPRAELAGARLALSAAFCICAAAGMLLLRSMAAERSAQNQNLHQSIAMHNHRIISELPEQGHAPQLIAHRSPLRTISPIINRTFTHNLSYAAAGGTSAYEAPPAPVCSMTTFTIYTQDAATVNPLNNYTGANDSDEGSLIVWVVSGDDQGRCL